MYFGFSRGTYWAMSVVAATGFFLSIVLHELGHSLVARRFGVEMRGITLFIFGGVAEMPDEPPNPTAEVCIAVAGPLVSVCIGVACLAGGVVLSHAENVKAVGGVLHYLGGINLALVLFNLLPAFPLDGGRVLRASLWAVRSDLQSATRTSATVGSAFGIGLMVLGVFSFFGGGAISGMWYVMLGLFLRNAARLSYRQLVLRNALAGETIERFVRGDAISVNPGVPVSQFVDDYVLRHQHPMFPVIDDGNLVGCVEIRDVKELPRTEWPRHVVSEVAEPCDDTNAIDSRADAAAAWLRMAKNNRSSLIVTRSGELFGVVSLSDLLRHVALRSQIQSI